MGDILLRSVVGLRPKKMNPELDWHGKYILMLIASLADDKTKEYSTSLSEMSIFSGLPRQTVSKTLEGLRELGLLVKIPNPESHPIGSIYRVNVDASQFGWATL